MNAPERRKKIVELVNENNRMLVNDLAKLLITSEVTIRSDIKYLHEKGLLIRFYGGATSLSQGLLEKNIPVEKKILNEKRVEAQKAIAKRAIEFIKDHDTIIIGSGTTNTMLAEEIVNHNFTDLTIITNNLVVVSKLYADKNITLIVLGGMVSNGNHSTYGEVAEKTVEKLKVDLMFTGADGLDETGVSSKHEGFSLSATLAKYSNKVIVITEKYKIGKRCLNPVLSVEQIHHIIMESPPELDIPEIKEKLIIAN